MRQRRFPILAVLSLLGCTAPALAAPPGEAQRVAAAIRRLDQDTAGSAVVATHRATGVARFVRLPAPGLALPGIEAADRARTFLERYGAAFGVVDPAAQLSSPVVREDRYGFSHLTFPQTHRGIPVFAGLLRAHFDAAGRLTAVNGTFLPWIVVDPKPAWSSEKAGEVAREAVRSDSGERAFGVEILETRLVVFREGLAQGVPGPDHLAYEIEVGDGAGIREFVYVDAHTRKVVDRIQGIEETLTRKVHQGQLNNVVIWTEGQAQPYASGDSTNDYQVNNLIRHSADAYDLFSHLSGGAYLSWDGASATMHGVWEATSLSCPNASWNGTSTNYCDGVASDDVIAHEWTHAYTERTHGLVYQWQPGALNEAYSDVFGEVVDLINGFGTDHPATARSVGDCSTIGGNPPPSLVVVSPPAIARAWSAGGASFNPMPPVSSTATVEMANDGAGVTSDACQALVGFTAGRIALVDPGSCAATVKVKNAQNAGATAVILRNATDTIASASGIDGTIVIPSVTVAQSDGSQIKAQLGSAVTATVSLPVATSNAVRWLVSEDAFSFGGPIRDMWNPLCFSDPGRVTDRQYACATSDSGGVHTNSGIPNHGFALLADGGTFNGHTVAAIGLTKAAHVYWRAMDVYQVPTSDFADHADALAQACADLVGVNLTHLYTGNPSGQAIQAADCAAVGEAMLAIEARSAPPCVFVPLLHAGPAPYVCEGTAFSADFETDPTATWIRTNAGVTPEYTPRDWTWAAALPGGRSGHALFALDSRFLGSCTPGDDQSGVMNVETPTIALGGADGVSFRHYVATEPGYDGGNVRVSVNGGAYTELPPGSFLFNSYNRTLIGSGNTNPMAGQSAFSGTDGGALTGSWGASQATLSGLAGPTDTIRLRFDLGVDGCAGFDGWYLDDVQVCKLVLGAGHVPDAGEVPGSPLVLSKSGESISLSWSPSCLATDDDYEVYEGTIEDGFTSHRPRLCSTGGASTATFAPDAASSYYLVVPRNGSREGSYGKNGAGLERPPSASACNPQAVVAGCPGSR